MLKNSFITIYCNVYTCICRLGSHWNTTYACASLRAEKPRYWQSQCCYFELIPKRTLIVWRGTIEKNKDPCGVNIGKSRVYDVVYYPNAITLVLRVCIMHHVCCLFPQLLTISCFKLRQHLRVATLYISPNMLIIIDRDIIQPHPR